MNSKYLLFCCLIWVLLIHSIGCGTVGTDFDESRVNKIVKGSTHQREIQSMFGKPFRTGTENCRDIWIYEYNLYSAIGTSSSKDLTVVFDAQGKVHSYQIMSSSPK